MGKNEMVAMLLAGGKGTRLEALTRKVAKPAVYFGGKYRIIDFPLSNCSNSGINVVGVLTQYESVLLNSYIGSGNIWGLDGTRSKAVLLPPRQTEEGSSWYNGTADAILHNLDFLDECDPEYVLILSGDHIYKMNYDTMLAQHKEDHADVTIAVIEVTLEEASRFGIMNASDNGIIYEFEEKPKNPKSTLASMGIYIFNYKLLKEVLMDEAKFKRDELDFGKHIIPRLLQDQKKLVAHKFHGYWKDVGTIESLWQANMDLLDDTLLDMYNIERNWKIYSEDSFNLPQYIGAKAQVKNSIINQGCNIFGKVTNSVIFRNVVIEENAEVSDCVILPNAIIRKGAKVKRAIIGENEVIDENKDINHDGAKIVLIAD